MPNEVDKSLLDRLQALRGSSATPEKAEQPKKFDVDPIERKKTPTREDALAARLKSLRDQDDSSPTASVVKPAQPEVPSKARTDHPAGSTREKHEALAKTLPAGEDDDVDKLFQTDDQTLEELLSDVKPEDSFAVEPDDAEVQAVLDRIAKSIPKDGETKRGESYQKNEEKDSDDSEGEDMQQEVDSVIARFRDELEVEAARSKDEPKEPSEPDQDAKKDKGDDGDDDDQQPPPDLALPTVPTDDDGAAPAASGQGSSSLDDITARLSALRAPSSESPSLDLPSVPNSKPAKAPRRLESRTNYTDDDVESWCTVCLEDATLLCKGCSEEGNDGDPYCVRCWREMHVGPAAAFDERTHKAVQFSRKKKKKEGEKKVAIGAS